MKSLKDKVVWVTGASSGIGEALAYGLARKGATLILSARRKDQLERVKKECVDRYGVNVIVCPLDVSNLSEIDRVVDVLYSKLNKIDVLINNAGYGLSEKFIDCDFSEVENMFKVNVLGLMYLSQCVARNMAKHESGHIINVASIAGKVATPKSAVYSSTKFAVLGFSNALRLELKEHNIQVTTINPGPVDTAFFDKFDPEGSYLEKVESLVLTPEVVAEKTIKVIGTNKREVNLPVMLEFSSRFYSLFPSIGDFFIEHLFDKK
ncbi:SDR family oxidoreductase [Alkalibacterium sp. 20]|uniref:SDR family NAD(P)-dependent oxidoreductase n=1 Tax=Alkalibacterium sp. 20 TaxID=1798803 RepID=UPI0008FFE4ED|nr:SDR family oxidoreductase [Alkalibacterium sp. 20]OJF95194.1 short-chain dehydrogenase [Alkalibacterium sp. 20]